VPLDGSARLSSLTAAQRLLLIGEARDGQLELRVVLDPTSSTASSVDGMTGSPVSVGLAHRPVLGPPEPLGHRAARERGKPAAGPGGGAALRAEPRLDAEGQRLFVSAYEGFASPPSAPDVLAVLTADRRLDEAGRALLVALFTSLVTSSNGHATDAVTVELVDPNRASRRAFSSPKHGRSHDDRQTDVRTAR
jgi:hypothetical protein